MKIREYLDSYQKKMHIPAGYTYPDNGDYGFYRETEGGEIFLVYHDTGALPEDEHIIVGYDDPVLDAEWEWSVSSAAAALGRIGGKARSEAKRKASVENGKKGGRPKKQPKEE